jgi:hypothetical protein
VSDHRRKEVNQMKNLQVGPAMRQDKSGTQMLVQKRLNRAAGSVAT